MSELVANAEVEKEPVVAGETNDDEKEPQNMDTTEEGVGEDKGPTGDQPEDDGFDADSSDDEKGKGAQGGDVGERENINVEEKKGDGSDDEEGGGEEGDDMEEDGGRSEAAQPMHAQTPDSLQGMRACKRCGLIKTFQQFYDVGCENCPFLEMEEVRVVCSGERRAYGRAYGRA